jgi:hypothetical protein
METRELTLHGFNSRAEVERGFHLRLELREGETGERCVCRMFLPTADNG